MSSGKSTFPTAHALRAVTMTASMPQTDADGPPPPFRFLFVQVVYQARSGGLRAMQSCWAWGCPGPVQY